MDSVIECSTLECVEDNLGIINVSAAENMQVNNSPCNIRSNGFCVVESNDCETSEVVGKITVGSGTLNLSPVEIVPGLSPSSTITRKGNGLRKWRRIKKDTNKVGNGSVRIQNVVAQETLDSGPNPSTGMRFFSDKKLKSQGSVSSTNATVRSLDDFVLPGAAENCEIWCGKSSSTEASSPKKRSETSAVVGSTPQDQQRKSGIMAWKKFRGEKVNIEKENSHSSMESDLRSSNFVFMQGIYSTSTGIQSERSTDYDGDNGNEVQGIQQKVNNGLQLQDSEAGYKDYLPEHIRDDLSREIKGGNQNNGSTTDLDPLSESIFNLESVKDALEIELLKFREIRQDVLINNPVLDLQAEFTNDDQNPQETSSSPSQLDEGVHRFSFDPQSEVLGDRVVEAEIEGLFMQKINAEVEYLVLSKALQNFRVAVVDQITTLEEQKALASKQTQILNKLGDMNKKAMILNKEAVNLEKFCEDIASADETMKLQNSVCKYTTCFLVQLVSLALVLGIFIFQLSPKYIDNTPT